MRGMDLGIKGVKDDNYRWRDSCRLRSYCKSQKEEQKKNKRVSYLGLVVDGRNGESVPHFAASTPSLGLLQKKSIEGGV